MVTGRQRPYHRYWFRQVLLPDVVFSDVASLPAAAEVHYWAAWQVPHVFFDSTGAPPLVPEGWALTGASY